MAVLKPHPQDNPAASAVDESLRTNCGQPGNYARPPPVVASRSGALRGAAAGAL